MKPKDDYDFETLTVPAILVCLPPSIIAALLGFSVSKLVGLTILGIEVLAFLLVPASALIRDAGKKIEKHMFASGMPTTISLRSKPASKNLMLRDRRQAVAQASNMRLLSYSQARYNRTYEDEVIENAVGKARERMRGDKFLILRRELKSYGYWRNVYALRPIGITVSMLCFVIWLIYLLSSSPVSLPPIAIITRICFGIALLIFVLFWLLFINKQRVSQAANRYASQFFKSLILIK